MSWDANLYFSPEKFGVSIVGDINWVQPSYSFDQTVVWWSPAEKVLMWADDSGCSCPTPFGDVHLGNVERGSLVDLQAHLEKHLSGAVGFEHWYDEYDGSVSHDHAAAKEAATRLLLRAKDLLRKVGEQS